MDPKFEKAQRERQKRERDERLARPGVPWDPKLKWQPQLTLKADTWLKWDLFDVEPTKNHNPNWEKKPEGKFAFSPSGSFMFCKKVLQRGQTLGTLQGSKQGDVMFDADIAIPALHEKTGGGDWRENPWMSITPMELMTQRPGIRFAKGHVVIAGLGLGWMLVEVLKKKSVKKVTLVERSQELVDWIMPAIAPMIRNLGKDMDTVVEDAYVAVPKLTADVALIDIFPNYGSNDFLDDLYLRDPKHRPAHQQCPNIGRVWSWGKSHVGDY
jgi:hypothetical protein